ncbi:hypothetical protein [Achromobacter insuavis]|uniref:DUF551 domain-containing protein n=1 Tax=Achromobacter insuavis AXX-A TaxID=1003200 RepID=F7T9I8_9BURK|nr:hypothetical protein [Achromobacter insuavis]EGP42993.1 hypothetical protein AXXA_28130 [Achromobacter insuavis AXX-A]
MTEFEIKHGLSQCPPGPLEPVELAQQDDTLARTGNTACDQEMYAAGLEKGEENAKHNAAIRGAWLPIESAPQTGRTLLLGYWNSLGKWRTVRGQWMSLDHIAENWEEPDDAEAGWFETAVEAEEAPNCWRITPSHWQPLPAAPGTPASPVSTVEQEPPAAYLTLDEEDSPCMLFFDVVEARTYCEVGEDPEPLYRRPAPAAGDARDAERYRHIRDSAAAIRNGWPADGFVFAMQFRHAPGTIPSQQAVHGPALDAAIDAAIAAQRQGDA